MGLGSSTCFVCNNIEEDTLQVIRDCPGAVVLWMTTVNTKNHFNIFVGILKNWIYYNMNANLGWNTEKDWTTFWATACHSIWTWHNKETHVEVLIDRRAC